MSHIRATFVSIIATAILAGCMRNPYNPNISVGIPIVINEFMAANTADSPYPIFDEFGEADDWIELYNTGDKPINMQDLYLSDDSNHLAKYELPNAIIGPHGYFLVWADHEPEQGPNHAPFMLSATMGEEIILSVSGGKIIDRIQFFPESDNPEARLPNASYGRRTDGGDSWCRQAIPSPGRLNNGCWE